MQIHIITIFPKMFQSVFAESMINRAQLKGVAQIQVHNLRVFTNDKRETVDDKPFGGGPGMVMKIQPIYNCLESVDRLESSKIILLDPSGRQFNQNIAKKLAKLKQLIFICGRYQDLDARVEESADEKISIGPYILSGGELAAAVVIEAVSRFLPGVLGNKNSLAVEVNSFPQYTRPRIFKTKSGQELIVPSELLSGDHKKIAAWRSRK